MAIRYPIFQGPGKYDLQASLFDNDRIRDRDIEWLMANFSELRDKVRVVTFVALDEEKKKMLIDAIITSYGWLQHGGRFEGIAWPLAAQCDITSIRGRYNYATRKGGHIAGLELNQSISWG